MHRNIGLNIGRQRRVAKYYDNQDNLPPLSEWPAWAQRSALNDNKSNHERFQFFQFLWRNGLPPYMCGEWTRIIDYQHNKRLFNNDPKAVKHVNQMIRQAQTDTGDGLMSKGRVFDLRSKRPL